MTVCVSDVKHRYEDTLMQQETLPHRHTIKREREYVINGVVQYIYTVYKELNPSSGLIFFLCFRGKILSSPAWFAYSIFCNSDLSIVTLSSAFSHCQVFKTYSNEDYDRRNEEVDPVASSAEYELEKRVEKLELLPVELEKGE